MSQSCTTGHASCLESAVGFYTMDRAELNGPTCVGFTAADMPRQTDPPKRLADRVRRRRLALVRNRRREIDLEEALYLAAYEANQGGWSYQALGETLGEARSTVQNWCEIGRRVTERQSGGQ